MNWDEATCTWGAAPNTWESSNGPCEATAVVPAGHLVESPGSIGDVKTPGHTGNVGSD